MKSCLVFTGNLSKYIFGCSRMAKSYFTLVPNLCPHFGNAIFTAKFGINLAIFSADLEIVKKIWLCKFFNGGLIDLINF